MLFIERDVIDSPARFLALSRQLISAPAGVKPSPDYAFALNEFYRRGSVAAFRWQSLSIAVEGRIYVLSGARSHIGLAEAKRYLDAERPRGARKPKGREATACTATKLKRRAI